MMGSVARDSLEGRIDNKDQINQSGDETEQVSLTSIDNGFSTIEGE